MHGIVAELWSNPNEIKSYFTRIRKFVLAVARKIKDCTFKPGFHL